MLEHVRRVLREKVTQLAEGAFVPVHPQDLKMMLDELDELDLARQLIGLARKTFEDLGRVWLTAKPRRCPHVALEGATPTLFLRASRSFDLDTALLDMLFCDACAAQLLTVLDMIETR